MKVGDEVFVEQAWEDERGDFHDEIGTVVKIDNGLVEFEFSRPEITEWLRNAEFKVEDYEDQVIV